MDSVKQLQQYQTYSTEKQQFYGDYLRNVNLNVSKYPNESIKKKQLKKYGGKTIVTFGYILFFILTVFFKYPLP